MRLTFRAAVAFAAVLASALMTWGSSAVAAEPSASVGTPSASVLTAAIPDGKISAAIPKSIAAQAATTCNWTGASVTGSPSYFVEAPQALATVAWTGTVNAFCTGSNPVTISTSVQLTDPQGVPHLVASGAGIPVNTGYVCSQAATNCAGAWSAKFTLTFTAKPGSTWPGGGGCVASGAVLTCTLSGAAGIVPPVRIPSHTVCTESTSFTFSAADVPCYNLPPSGQIPLLTLRAIKNIRDSHFDGGSAVDSSKGRFYSHLTNTDLQKIWEAGMTSADKWKLNSTGYFEKTFAYEGAGTLSTSHGNGAAATQVTLVVEQYGAGPTSEVVTMYPGPQ